MPGFSKRCLTPTGMYADWFSESSICSSPLVTRAVPFMNYCRASRANTIARRPRLYTRAPRLAGYVYNGRKRLGGVEGDFRAMIDDSLILKVWYLQRTLHSGAPIIGARFDIASPKVIIAVGTGTYLPEFNDDVFDAKREGILAGCESEWLITTDMIMSGRDCSGAEIYIVAIASFALNTAAIDRTLYCAELFRKVYPERDMRMALWYVNADDDCRNAAESAGIELVRTQIKWLDDS